MDKPVSVSEFIEILKGLPQDFSVYVADWAEMYASPEPLSSIGLHQSKKTVVLQEDRRFGTGDFIDLEDRNA